MKNACKICDRKREICCSDNDGVRLRHRKFHFAEREMGKLMKFPTHSIHNNRLVVSKRNVPRVLAWGNRSQMAGTCLTTLILNHALWLGLFVFLIIFFSPILVSSHFHPVLIKKVAQSQLHSRNLCPKPNTHINFPSSLSSFGSGVGLKNVKITMQNEERKAEAWFTTIYLKYFGGGFYLSSTGGGGGWRPFARIHTFHPCPQASSLKAKTLKVAQKKDR